MPYVYKYVLNDEIIYIGKSNQENFNRLRQHGNGNESDNIPVAAHREIDAAKIYIAGFESALVTDAIESLLIQKYRPKYNVRVTNTYEGLDCGEIKWIPLEELQMDFGSDYPTFGQLLMNYQNNKRRTEYLQNLVKEYESNRSLCRFYSNLYGFFR